MKYTHQLKSNWNSLLNVRTNSDNILYTCNFDNILYTRNSDYILYLTSSGSLPHNSSKQTNRADWWNSSLIPRF